MLQGFFCLLMIVAYPVAIWRILKFAVPILAECEERTPISFIATLKRMGKWLRVFVVAVGLVCLSMTIASIPIFAFPVRNYFLSEFLISVVVLGSMSSITAMAFPRATLWLAGKISAFRDH